MPIYDNIRRSQLIAPFGVGSLSVLKDGVTVITAGLDHWFEREGKPNPLEDIEKESFRIHEPRLTRRLHVDKLYWPPEFRRRSFFDNDPINKGLTIPFLSFPRWHVCSYCNRMEELALHENRPARERICPYCKGNGRKWQRLRQVRFIAMCEAGHLQDFPWLEWVHRSTNPECRGPLKLMVGRGASLSAIRIECINCQDRRRNLHGIMRAFEDGTTYLSANLAAGDDQIYLCQGCRPWLQEDATGECQRHLRASLRGALNVHFGRMRTAIYLPSGSLQEQCPRELVNWLVSEYNSDSTFRTLYDTLRQIEGSRTSVVRDRLNDRTREGTQSFKWTDGQINSAIEAADNIFSEEAAELEEEQEQSEVEFRYEEFQVLGNEIDDDLLKICVRGGEEYQEELYGVPFSDYIEQVSLIDKLRETRAFFGFTRVQPNESVLLAEAKRMLYRHKPKRGESWLPASCVYGEGIFIKFKEDCIQSWETKLLSHGHLKPMLKAVEGLKEDNRVSQEFQILPRFVLLHTFAHLLINRLIFECGYSSASLRERLFVSDKDETRMSAIMIYTAAGDSEGSLGGLVRMGTPGRLEAVVRRALEEARWCSVDPVCMEIGQRSGQGPNSCNMAACHSCALLPETSCEQFNRFLDRGVVVGTHEDSSSGFFIMSSH